MSKLPKLPASSALDPSSMSFGPPRLGPGGGLGTWGRGSGNKKLSVQETAPLKQVNRWGTFTLIVLIILLVTVSCSGSRVCWMMTGTRRRCLPPPCTTAAPASPPSGRGAASSSSTTGPGQGSIMSYLLNLLMLTIGWSGHVTAASGRGRVPGITRAPTRAAPLEMTSAGRGRGTSLLRTPPASSRYNGDFDKNPVKLRSTIEHFVFCQ